MGRYRWRPVSGLCWCAKVIAWGFFFLRARRSRRMSALVLVGVWGCAGGRARHRAEKRYCGAALPRWRWQPDTARLAMLARVPVAQLALSAAVLSPMYQGGGWGVGGVLPGA